MVRPAVVVVAADSSPRTAAAPRSVSSRHPSLAELLLAIPQDSSVNSSPAQDSGHATLSFDVALIDIGGRVGAAQAEARHSPNIHGLDR